MTDEQDTNAQAQVRRALVLDHRTGDARVGEILVIDYFQAEHLAAEIDADEVTA